MTGNMAWPRALVVGASRRHKPPHDIPVLDDLRALPQYGKDKDEEQVPVYRTTYARVPYCTESWDRTTGIRYRYPFLRYSTSSRRSTRKWETTRQPREVVWMTFLALRMMVYRYRRWNYLPQRLFGDPQDGSLCKASFYCSA